MNLVEALELAQSLEVSRRQPPHERGEIETDGSETHLVEELVTACAKGTLLTE
jgi:hypothetical protein